LKARRVQGVYQKMIVYNTTLDNVQAADLQGFLVGWGKPLTPEQHYRILQNSEYLVIASDPEKKRVVGFINALSERVHFAFIPMLEVLPEYQGKGIGTELMKRLLEQVTHLGCIDLSCDENLQRFYEKFGMVRHHAMLIRR
jgi:GNAT superfamily N-acetyltransferase